MKIYPLLLKPVYKDYLWGGDRIIKVFNRDEPPGIYAESWEVSTRDDGMSTIANGALSGKPLAEAVDLWGRDLLGARSPDRRFPLLIKLIDARQCLSLQVHPDDASAAAHGGEAKTECWHVLGAEPGASVYAGFKEPVSKEAFLAAVKEKRLGDLLYRTSVAEGETVFIPGGLVHAIDAGCLLLEVQQNSNTTYRLYDWDRVGPDGRPRELHIEQALHVIDWDIGDQPVVSPTQIFDKSGNERWLAVESPYFRLIKIRLHDTEPVDGSDQTFVVLFVCEGCAEISWEGGCEELPAGTSCLVPAGLRGVSVKPKTDGAEIMHISLPDPDALAELSDDEESVDE